MESPSIEPKQRVAFYVRVSKDEEPGNERYQNPENQITPLKKYAEAMNLQVVGEYIDRRSGATANRPQFRLMFADAAKGKFDGILIWALDRFSREGILTTLAYIRNLKERHIWIKSYEEGWLDTKETTGDLIIAVLSWVAAEERRKISERTKAGITTKKFTGTYRGGKPKRCMTCGWQHSPRKSHIEPFNAKYLPVPAPPPHQSSPELSGLNSGSLPPLPPP